MSALTGLELSTQDWVLRCCERISALDSTLDESDVRELGQALADRPSCRALQPERAADLLFEGKLSQSAWGALDSDR
jgi:hypothetical protein